MDTAIDMTNIMVPEIPIEVDFGDWIISHPSCDTVIEEIQGSPKVLVYAYATSEDGNKALHLYRDRELSGMEISKGVSERGIR